MVSLSNHGALASTSLRFPSLSNDEPQGSGSLQQPSTPPCFGKLSMRGRKRLTIFSLLQQPLEMLANPLASFFQMRFHHAEFRQIQPAQKNIG